MGNYRNLADNDHLPPQKQQNSQNITHLHKYLKIYIFLIHI